MGHTYQVAGIGELLWDVLPTGKQAGGAPFNFAFHASQAGCESYIFSAVGRDGLGEEMISRVKGFGISNKYIQENDYPTGTVSVSLDETGRPTYSIHENVAWDFIRLDEDMQRCSGTLDAVCFGSLARRNPVSETTIRSFLSGLNPECLKVFDMNLRQHYFTKEIITESLQLADILKLNDEELPVLTSYLGFGKEMVRSQLHRLLHIFGLKYIVYTMGSEGSIIISLDEYSVMKAPDVNVCDTVGAGDAFTAILVTGLLNKKPIKEIHESATKVAAYVCTRKGATPKIPADILTIGM